MIDGCRVGTKYWAGSGKPLGVPESLGQANDSLEGNDYAKNKTWLGGVDMCESGYYRRALWSEIRNPKPETRNKFKCPMVQGQEPPAV